MSPTALRQTPIGASNPAKPSASDKVANRLQKISTEAPELLTAKTEEAKAPGSLQKWSPTKLRHGNQKMANISPTHLNLED